MANVRTFMKSGHPPTLLAAFLYFDFSFAIWVLNGAMAPFITKDYHLTKEQAALMISLPTLAGALMRFPLGVLSQYIGSTRAWPWASPGRATAARRLPRFSRRCWPSITAGRRFTALLA